MTSFNDQWVLDHTPPGRGESAPVGETVGQPSEVHRADAQRVPAHAHPGTGFGHALTPRRVRKHPRWIDRDT